MRPDASARRCGGITAIEHLRADASTSVSVQHRSRRPLVLRGQIMKRFVLLVLINFAVLATLLFTANLVSITATETYRSVFAPTSSKYRLPNYEGQSWPQQHFQEFERLDSRYFAFHGWRRTPYQGQTMTIDQEGKRRTYANPSAEPSKTIAFFGGSTMWGTGADDEHTIPSFFARMNSDYAAYNFGETAYTARQSLNYLMNKLAEGKQYDVVVFYDGVNDVYYKCRYELGPFSHSRELEIRAMLDRSRGLQSYLALVQPVLTFSNKVVERMRMSRTQSSEDAWFDCDDKDGKTEVVARSMLTDWLAAKSLVEAYGGRFLAILQPNAYLSEPRTDHIDLDPQVERQYELVYPKILELLASEFQNLEENFMNLTQAFDRDEYIFIDYCHVSPNGNEIIASHVASRLAEVAPDRLSASDR